MGFAGAAETDFRGFGLRRPKKRSTVFALSLQLNSDTARPRGTLDAEDLADTVGHLWPRGVLPCLAASRLSPG